MKYRAVFWTLLAIAVLMALSASLASAAVDHWSFGGAFQVGGIHFRIGLAEAGPYGSSYYFEAAQPFRYSGYACGSHCYRRGRNYYHHPSCRAVNHHFNRHGYAPNHLIAYYGPPVAYPPQGYYPSPGYDRYNTHRHYGRDKHYWKRERHHVPPGQLKKHHRGSFQRDSCRGHSH